MSHMPYYGTPEQQRAYRHMSTTTHHQVQEFAEQFGLDGYNQGDEKMVGFIKEAIKQLPSYQIHAIAWELETMCEGWSSDLAYLIEQGDAFDKDGKPLTAQSIKAKINERWNPRT